MGKEEKLFLMSYNYDCVWYINFVRNQHVLVVCLSILCRHDGTSHFTHSICHMQVYEKKIDSNYFLYGRFKTDIFSLF